MKSLYLSSLLTVLFTISCGGSVISGITGSKKKNDLKTESGSSDSKDEDKAAPGTRKIRNNGQSFLLKTSGQLQSAIQTCFGGRRTEIVDEILFNIGGDGAPDTEGTAFLSPGDYHNGEDIIEASRAYFDGREADKRTGVSNGVVTVGYLTALQNTGNVVAYNCSEAGRNQGSNPELCQCETVEQAQAMLMRCLPQFIPDDLADMAKELNNVCKSDQRGAISSLISSFAFAGSN